MPMFTTLNTLKRSVVLALRVEADRAGDKATVRDCATYLKGNEYGAAAKRLVRTINDREAQG